MIKLAQRLGAVRTAQAAQVAAQTRALQAQGHDIISMAIGEPDFPTPAHIIDAAHIAAKAGQTRYPPTGGTADLKSAIAAAYLRNNDLSFDMDNIIVSNGAKQVIFNALAATIDEDDEVIVAPPFYASYADMVALLGGCIVYTKPDANLRLTPAALAEAITPKTRWLIINNPTNPSGVHYNAQELRAFGKILADHPHVMILCDEIYEHILYDGRAHVAFAKACPDLGNRILNVNGVSKAYAMTGWRIGYAAGPKQLIAAMIKIQSQTTSGACSIAQAAAVAALNGPHTHIAQWVQCWQKRRDFVDMRIKDIAGLSLLMPQGAFYGFIACDDLINAPTNKNPQLHNDADLAQYLLHAGVSIIPGTAYGQASYFRLSFALNDADLARGLDRIEQAAKRLASWN